VHLPSYLTYSDTYYTWTAFKEYDVSIRVRFSFSLKLKERATISITNDQNQPLMLLKTMEEKLVQYK
jgi:hypothetical protein